jgi:hypothetical protein
MANVCEDWFPLTGKDKRPAPGFYMNDMLKEQLDILIKNVKNDWDFTIIIGGQGEMRVGKSMLGMQIGSYWTYMIEKLYGIKVPFNIKENFVLNGNELVSKGNKLGEKYKYAVLDYDEAADDLESTKVMRASTQAIKDHLRKAAQYNMLNIIIQAEFFEIPKSIALSRSVCLLDVYYVPDKNGIFQRGYFNFFGRRTKKKLYLFGKKELNYQCVKPDFFGTFNNFYTVPEEEYRKEKREALTRWKKYSGADIKQRALLQAAVKMLYQTGLTHREIAAGIGKLSKFRVSHTFMGHLIKNEDYDDEDEPEEGA